MIESPRLALGQESFDTPARNSPLSASSMPWRTFCGRRPMRSGGALLRERVPPVVDVRSASAAGAALSPYGKKERSVTRTCRRKGALGLLPKKSISSRRPPHAGNVVGMRNDSVLFIPDSPPPVDLRCKDRLHTSGGHRRDAFERDFHGPVLWRDSPGITHRRKVAHYHVLLNAPEINDFNLTY